MHALEWEDVHSNGDDVDDIQTRPNAVLSGSVMYGRYPGGPLIRVYLVAFGLLGSPIGTCAGMLSTRCPIRGALLRCVGWW